MPFHVHDYLFFLVIFYGWFDSFCPFSFIFLRHTSWDKFLQPEYWIVQNLFGQLIDHSTNFQIFPLQIWENFFSKMLKAWTVDNFFHLRSFCLFFTIRICLFLCKIRPGVYIPWRMASEKKSIWLQPAAKYTDLDEELTPMHFFCQNCITFPIDLATIKYFKLKERDSILICIAEILKNVIVVF